MWLEQSLVLFLFYVILCLGGDAYREEHDIGTEK